MKIFPLTKTVLSIQNNPAQFLKGISTNTLENPHNAFVTIHGRIIATVDQIEIDEDTVWLVVESSFVDNLLAHLDRYIKLSGVVVTQLAKHVYFDLDGTVPLAKEDIVIPQKSGRLVVTDKKFVPTVTEHKFTLFRLKNNIPIHGIDFNDEMILNVSTTDYVSFTKGCFLGQEPIAKVYNRSKPSWRLVVRYEDECTSEECAKMTSVVVDTETNRRLGFVFVGNVS